MSPSDDPFPSGFDTFRIAKYLFRCRAATALILPPYKGSALHGGFGHALKNVSPHYYKELFEPGKSGDHPKPFVLLPPLDTLNHYPAGHVFDMELTLFGDGVALFPICRAALEHLGKELGFSNNRGRYDIVEVAEARPASIPEQGLRQGVSGQVISRGRAIRADGGLTLVFPTRLRLQNNGRLVRHAPPFPVLLARLLGRLNSLAAFYGNGPLCSHDLREELLHYASSVHLEQDTCRWHDLPRYSGRQKNWMKFGGLLGSVTYSGKLQPFLPWLALGEWTHVGGKTSFGLGKYVMESAKN